MNDFELKLRRLKLRAPSDALDERIMGLKPESPERPSAAGWRVRGWSAVAASVVMVCVGFVAGAVWSAALRGQSDEPTMVVHVLYESPSSTNPFDFTRAAANPNEVPWETHVVQAVNNGV